MSHVPPLADAELGAVAPVLQAAAAAMGFVPNSMRVMAQVPQLPAGFLLLSSVVFGADLRDTLARLAPVVESLEPTPPLPPELVQLVALATSQRSGCRYCQAHTAHGAHQRGVDEDKLADLLRFEDSRRFSPAERAALALAFAAAAVPNEADEAHFDALREHFSDAQIVQLVAVIALFGFLNRWNDTLATTLEAAPADFAGQALAGLGWQAGKHG